MKRLFLKLTAAAAVGALVGACGGTDSGDDESAGSMIDVAARSGEISALVAAARRAGLESALAADGANLTVLAPTNEAWANLSGQLGFRSIQALIDALPVDMLAQILSYHVLPTRLTKADLLAGGASQPTLLTRDGSPVSLPLNTANNGVRITDEIGREAITNLFDVPADNGLFHVIDTVMMPAGLLTVLQTVQSDPERFRSLAQTIGGASGSNAALITALNDAGGDYTVFAPVNDAFRSASTVLAPLNPDQVRVLLQYHALGQRVPASAIAFGTPVATLAGQNITFVAGSPPSIDDTSATNANITATDILCSNGFVHVIDKVLLPTL
jgi:transforming growth factor-beta-induced protein